MAIECKISQSVRASDIKGLFAFHEEFCPKRCIVASQDPVPRRIQSDSGAIIEIMPWKDFLAALWAGEVL